MQFIGDSWQETVWVFGRPVDALAHATREGWEVFFLLRLRRVSLRQVLSLRILEREGGETSMGMLRVSLRASTGDILADMHNDLMPRGLVTWANYGGERVANMAFKITEEGGMGLASLGWLFGEAQ